MSTLLNNIGAALNTSSIRGEGPVKQSNKLNLGHTNIVSGVQPEPVKVVSAPQIVEKKVYVEVDSVEEKNIIAEAYAKMALLIMENKRLRARLATRQAELKRL